MPSATISQRGECGSLLDAIQQSGRWAFAEFTDVYEMQTDFKEKVEAEFNKMIETTIGIMA